MAGDYPRWPGDSEYISSPPNQRYKVRYRMGPVRRISFKVLAGSFGDAAILARQRLVAWEAENPHERPLNNDHWQIETVEAY